MSYGRDPDAASRGVGAIAARDRAQPRQAAWMRRRVMAATQQRDLAMSRVANGALGIVPSLVTPNIVAKPKAAPTFVTTKLSDGTVVRDHRGTPTSRTGVPSPISVLLNTTLRGVVSGTRGALPTPSAPQQPAAPVVSPPPPPASAPPALQPVVSPAPPPPTDAAPVSSGGGGGGGGGSGVMTSAPPPATSGPAIPSLPDLPIDTSAPPPAVDNKVLWIAGGVAAALGAYLLLRKRGPA